MSEITRVEPMDPNKENSPIAGPVSDESTVMLNTAKKTCLWNGQEFQEGDMICDAGASYECNVGNWVKRDEPC